MDMEKFEMDEEKLDIFNDFTNKTKDALSTLIDDIKRCIKEYQEAIKKTNNQISENEKSKSKCENEIVNMKVEINGIKEAIDNVQSTYKKMVDAYSETSKGSTKEIYSEIIESARLNCENDVEKSRNEITKLNSTIEAIKNNISEFKKTIDSLKVDLANYKEELAKYNKALDYMEDTFNRITMDFDNILSNKEVEETSVSVDEDKDELKSIINNLNDVENVALENEKPKEEANVVSESPKETIDFDNSLKQIYDLTGYKPKKKEEEKKEEAKEVIEETLNDTKEEEKENKSKNDDFVEWEKILSGSENIFDDDTNNIKEEPIKESDIDVVNSLLKPYGTSYDSLSNLISDKITYKDGKTIDFNLSPKDLIEVINEIDGNDLKKMKIVGPEITLLKKVKSMKEGK